MVLQCSVFHSGIRPGGKAPRASGWAPRGNVTKNFFWGFAPDFIVGSGGVFRGERSGGRPAVGEEEKFTLRLRGAGGKNEEKKEKL
jgi:hypothetical protein